MNNSIVELVIPAPFREYLLCVLLHILAGFLSQLRATIRPWFTEEVAGLK